MFHVSPKRLWTITVHFTLLYPSKLSVCGRRSLAKQIQSLVRLFRAEADLLSSTINRRTDEHAARRQSLRCRPFDSATRQDIFQRGFHPPRLRRPGDGSRVFPVRPIAACPFRPSHRGSDALRKNSSESIPCVLPREHPRTISRDLSNSVNASLMTHHGFAIPRLQSKLKYAVVRLLLKADAFPIRRVRGS